MTRAGSGEPRRPVGCLVRRLGRMRTVWPSRAGRRAAARRRVHLGLGGGERGTGAGTQLVIDAAVVVLRRRGTRRRGSRRRSSRDRGRAGSRMARGSTHRRTGRGRGRQRAEQDQNGREAAECRRGEAGTATKSLAQDPRPGGDDAAACHATGVPSGAGGGHLRYGLQRAGWMRVIRVWPSTASAEKRTLSPALSPASAAGSRSR